MKIEEAGKWLRLWVRRKNDGLEADLLQVWATRGSGGRKLRVHRAHGLIRKVPTTHRYQLTALGRLAIAAIFTIQRSSLTVFNKPPIQNSSRLTKKRKDGVHRRSREIPRRLCPPFPYARYQRMCEVLFS
ncbi:MAG: hypothetical protein U0Q16_20400 [Bryobacteraceae bacterium]